MFQINVSQVEQHISDLQQQARRLNQAIGRVEDVIRGIRGMSGNEGVVQKLKSDVMRMEEERRNLADMTGSLMQIAEMYSYMEKGICDYAEGAPRRAKSVMQWHKILFTAAAENALRQMIR